MTYEKITYLLEQLNEYVFHNCLEIVSEKDGRWLIQFKDLNCERICWLNTRQCFELRQGPGGDFTNWVTCYIIDQIASEFDGEIDDECLMTRIEKYGVLNTWDDNLDELHKNFNKFGRFILKTLMKISVSTIYSKGAKKARKFKRKIK